MASLKASTVVVLLSLAALSTSTPTPDDPIYHPLYRPTSYHPAPPVYSRDLYHPPHPVYKPKPVYKPEPVYKPVYKPDPYHKPVYDETPKPYAFDYGVRDDYTGTNFGHTENSDGKSVKGSYTVALPDGRIQTVNYVADHYNGFQAEVTYSGQPIYPETKPAYHQPSYKPAPKPYHPAPKPYHPAPKPVYHPAPKPVYHPAPKPVYHPKPVYKPVYKPIYTPGPYKPAYPVYH